MHGYKNLVHDILFTCSSISLIAIGRIVVKNVQRGNLEDNTWVTNGLEQPYDEDRSKEYHDLPSNIKEN